MSPAGSGRGAAHAAGLALAATLLLGGVPAGARPLELDDLLRQQSVGAVSITPDDRWALVELRGGPAEAARFDFGRFNPLFRTRLMVADLRAGGALRPLMRHDPGAGYLAGPVSPDGARVAVFRLTAGRWDLGIVIIATGEVLWTGTTPEAPSAGRTVQWLTSTRLAAVVLPPGALPYEIRAQRPQLALPARWAATAAGQAAVTAVGSGRYIGLRPHGPPKRLVTIAADGRVREIARGDIVDLEASPDGRRIALLEAAEDIRLAPGRPVQGAYGVADRRMRLRILDLASGADVAPCPGCDLLASLLAWSADGGRLLVYARADGAPWTAGRFVRIDAASGAATPLGPNVRAAIAGRPERVYAGWLGDDPVVFGRPAAAARDDWLRLAPDGTTPVLTGALAHPGAADSVVAGGELLTLADGAAWAITAEGQARRLPTPDVRPLPRPGGEYPDRTRAPLNGPEGLRALASDGGATWVAHLDAVRGASRLAALPPGTRALAAGRTGALIEESIAGDATALAWRTPARDFPLVRLNPDQADIERPTPQAVRHVGPRGEPLTSWLLVPPGAAGAAPPPLVVMPYPGSVYRRPPDPARLDSPMASASVLVGHGYAVLLPSLPPPAGDAGPAEDLAGRLLAIVDAAARQPDLAGRFDPTRLALWGHSFGAYAVVASIGQTDRFGAAVASAPATDLIGVHGAFNPVRRIYPEAGVSTPWTAGWVEDLQGDMRAPPWADPQRYLRNSPLMGAGRIATPLLLAYGEIDGSHPAQAEQLFSALYRQDKDAILLTYWGEPHLFGSPGNLRDFYRRALAFLDERLAFSGSSTAPPPAHPARGSASSAPTTPAPPRR
ncbi:prolyl oligopeptidase family serine peptidase [Phenylobacterium sp.]|uniref:alpha/beta hydrolase family protein n=1 Tax=Phenylobacterium sp. TaxID=1871053 RepID=UPI0025E89EBC|nr:prolyl oligopeptidase family serine peptidase [Phenylobacterium sp.]